MCSIRDFITDYNVAVASNGQRGVLELVSRAVSAPTEILDVLGEARRAGLQVLYRSAALTVLNLIWGPQMCQLPHDHRMWAVIGIYRGREDNIFCDGQEAIPMAGSMPWSQSAQRTGDGAAGAGHHPLRHQSCQSLDGAIHVYGGDFFAVSHRGS